MDLGKGCDRVWQSKQNLVETEHAVFIIGIGDSDENGELTFWNPRSNAHPWAAFKVTRKSRSDKTNRAELPPTEHVHVLFGRDEIDAMQSPF